MWLSEYQTGQLDSIAQPQLEEDGSWDITVWALLANGRNWVNLPAFPPSGFCLFVYLRPFLFQCNEREMLFKTQTGQPELLLERGLRRNKYFRGKILIRDGRERGRKKSFNFKSLGQSFHIAVGWDPGEKTLPVSRNINNVLDTQELTQSFIVREEWLHLHFQVKRADKVRVHRRSMGMERWGRAQKPQHSWVNDAKAGRQLSLHTRDV